MQPTLDSHSYITSTLTVVCSCSTFVQEKLKILTSIITWEGKDSPEPCPLAIFFLDIFGLWNVVIFSKRCLLVHHCGEIKCYIEGAYAQQLAKIYSRVLRPKLESLTNCESLFTFLVQNQPLSSNFFHINCLKSLSPSGPQADFQAFYAFSEKHCSNHCYFRTWIAKCGKIRLWSLRNSFYLAEFHSIWNI